MQNLQGFHSIAKLYMLADSVDELKIAEKRVCEILSMVRPTLVSENRRKEIIEYVQNLISSTYGIEVFPIGSVPLKTYLPDGDVDLTVLCCCDEEVLSSALCGLLQKEERMNRDMRVRNVQYVPAQVKVVKCTVGKISVDISFNQAAGLRALSFLDQVDELIGQNHLFKLSIILIKAWCFYESRILGSNSGLISSYALETMVLHIINLFHSSLRNPLAALRKFLEYFSKFDWGKHCVAVDGLVLVSSLPEIVVQKPDGSDDMLLSAEFLHNCRDSYVHSTGRHQNGEQTYNIKFLNIVDPLRVNNNLGRCVNQANYHRIKAALRFGNRKLTATLALPPEEITQGIEDFFQTVLGRISGGRRCDAVTLPELGNRPTKDTLTTDKNQDLLAGIQYGLWAYDVPIPIGKMAWSRGTGPYIPQPVYPPRRSFPPTKRGSGPSSPYFPGACSSGKASSSDGMDLLPEKEACDSQSSEDFPPLPCKPGEIKCIPPSPYWGPKKATEASSSTDNTEIGITKDSEWEPASPVQLRLPSVSSLAGDPPSAEDAKEEPEEKKAGPENPPIQLDNVDEFPDLPLMRLMDAKEFPPLSGKAKKGASKRKSKK